MPSDKGTQREA